LLEVFLLGVIFGAILIIFARSSKINELEERIVRAIVWIENSDDEKQSTPYDISRETKQALLDILTDVEKGN
jgi:hypothetical protein